MADNIKEYAINFDRVVQEREKAYYIDFGDKKVWLPKSQVRVYRKKRKLYGPEWLFIEKGLV